MIRKSATFGITETLFKEHFSNVTRDLKHPKYINGTELSKYIWRLRDANISLVIEWSIVTKALSKHN